MQIDLRVSATVVRVYRGSFMVNKDMRYKYPVLYRTSPRLYNFGYKTVESLLNLKFVISNLGHISDVKTTDKIIEEYKEVIAPITNSKVKLSYPSDYAMDYKSGLYLYAFIRSIKPKTILETGVANGFSTHIILDALNRNNKGKCYSVEVSDDVGNLLTDKDKKRWVLNVGEPKKGLTDLLHKLDDIDIFIHDSDHSYENMKFEFEAVFDKLSAISYIMSDDAHGNNAFVEMYNKIHAKHSDAKLVIIPSLRRSFGCISVVK